MSDTVILYDLPSQEPCKAWSLNPWKSVYCHTDRENPNTYNLPARLVLNFKGIPYKTEWVEYPDIESHHKAKSIAPHADPSAIAPFTIPAIRLPNGTHLQDSLPIAHELERVQSSPSLHLDSPYLERLNALMPKAQMPLAPVFAPKVARILNPPSAEYFRRTREARFGMPLDDFEKSEKGGDAAWQGALPALKEIAAMLGEDQSGPFFMGKEPSYADLVFVGYMKMFDRIGQIDGILNVDKEAFGGVWRACQEWMKRDDH